MLVGNFNRGNGRNSKNVNKLMNQIKTQCVKKGYILFSKVFPKPSSSETKIMRKHTDVKIIFIKLLL